MTRHRLTAALTLGALIAALTACAPTPDPDAWQLTPLRHDNRLDGAPVAQPTDVTFPMILAPDHAGGVWGYSAGSWLHLDASGATLRRFNLLDGEAPAEIRGVAALTPTELVVSAPADGASGAVHLFDTAAGTWEVLHRADRILGDIAVHDGQVFVVSFETEVEQFTVRRLDPSSPGTLVDATPPLPWPPAITSTLHGSVAIDVAPNGSLHVATQAERLVVEPDGGIRMRAAHVVAVPGVATGPGGVAAWATSGGADLAPTAVTGGSTEARGVLAGPSDCAVLVARDVGDAVLALPCGQGIAWVGPDAFVASVGGESGAVLVRVEPPAAERGQRAARNSSMTSAVSSQPSTARVGMPRAITGKSLPSGSSRSPTNSISSNGTPVSSASLRIP